MLKTINFFGLISIFLKKDKNSEKTSNKSESFMKTGVNKIKQTIS